MSLSSQDDFPVYQVRPRFQVETPDTIEQLTEKINTALKKENAPCKGQVKHGFATLYLPKEIQHYWSPQLTLTLEETKNGSLLRGLFAPRPAVWTLFMFFYSLIGFATLIITMVGLSNLSLHKPGTILWWVPALIIVFLSLYLVAYMGKKMGKEQLLILHRFIVESTGLAI